MKKYLTILLICLLQNSFAQTTHYIDPTGSDANNGTIGSPWKTLHYAATQVTTPGDTIYVNAGTYIETAPSFLAVGVSIKGAGRDVTSIKSHFVGNWNQNNPDSSVITLVSTNPSDGNQSISGFTLDGDNLFSNIAIVIRRRGNVAIHDMRIKDFFTNAIYLNGSDYPYKQPGIRPNSFASNNTIYNTIIDNCTDSADTWVGGGLINMFAQIGLSIHDCTFSDTSRAAGRNGDIIVGEGWGYGFRYYNNDSYKPSNGYHAWNFHLEMPSEAADAIIYNSRFFGGDQSIDIGGDLQYTDLAYPIKYSVHDNYFEDYSPTMTGSHGKCAVTIEGISTKNIFVYNNTFKNIVIPWSISGNNGNGTPTVDSNIHIYNNVSINTGLNVVEFTNTTAINVVNSGSTLENVFIINNTVVPNPATHTTTMDITIEAGCTAKNIVLGNNIFTGADNGTWLRINNNGSIDSLIIRNNILYNNANSNNPTFNGNPVTHYINSGNLTSNPLLTSSTDYTPQAGSPAIGAAYPYGYGSDIGGIQTTAAPTLSISGDQPNVTTSSTSVSAVATWASGHTGTYAWSKTSGPGATTIGSPTSASTTVSGLQTGSYTFQCVVTQDDGQTASATVNITVTLPTNVPPTANAGTDQTITLPTSSITLSGSGTDTDGSIASYSWSKVSGSSGTITNASLATTTVTGLIAGTYVFRLTVTDNQGATGTDDVQITVNNAVTPNAYIKFRTPHIFINK